MYINDYRGCHGMLNAYQPSQELINLLIEAMKDERADRAKYGRMMEMTKDKKVKRQIEFAYDDEGKHYKMFQYIYHMITGQLINIPVPEDKIYDSLIEAVESSIDGELEAVELYRKIKSMLPNMQLRDMLYEIITDEQEHATRFVYLYTILHHMQHHMDNNDNKDQIQSNVNDMYYYVENIANLKHDIYKHKGDKKEKDGKCHSDKKCKSNKTKHGDKRMDDDLW
ncbi:ferritin-like domain-containing protein [Clostridium colicanis]|uniref:Rubrerythrin n=1 Tax=Clostridium colicanis DSM 13634 TaxID=1121305 RepID=A0A151AMT7_9CLOT|nr:ferritin-like domain-containing protein [Clostridium colicanis]KYH28948.1 rubrerythrin [Clostridium colicanis DSM 13634]